MNDFYWDKFYKSGKISDYLNFKNTAEALHNGNAGSNGACDKGEESIGSGQALLDTHRQSGSD